MPVREDERPDIGGEEPVAMMETVEEEAEPSVPEPAEPDVPFPPVRGRPPSFSQRLEKAKTLAAEKDISVTEALKEVGAPVPEFAVRQAKEYREAHKEPPRITKIRETHKERLEQAKILAKTGDIPIIQALYELGAKVPAYKFRTTDTVKVGFQTKTPQYVDKKTFEIIRKENPKLSDVLRLEGVAAYNKEISLSQFISQQELKRIERTDARAPAQVTPNIDRYKKSLEKLGGYTEFRGGEYFVDGSAYLRDHPKDRQTLLDVGISAQQIADFYVFNAKIDQAKDAPYDIRRAIFDAVFLPYINSYREAKAIGKKEVLAGKAMPKEVDKQVNKLLVHFADIAVPGVHTARNWATLSTKDKVVNIGLDVAAVALAVGLFKVVGAGVRATTLASKTGRLARVAGKAGRELTQATKDFSKLQSIQKMGSPAWVKNADKVAKLQAASMKADNAFLTSIQVTKKLSTTSLKALEKASGLKGIAKSIKDVSKAQRKVLKAWDKVGESPVFAEAKTSKQVFANNQHFIALNNLNKAQIALDRALTKAGSSLKPRYTPKALPATFKGYAMEWGKPKIKPTDSDTIKSVESWLARSRETKLTGMEPFQVRGGVAVATKIKTKVKPKVSKLKLKPIMEKVKVKAAPKPKASELPKVKPSVFPGIKPVGRPLVAPAILTDIERQELGRMTPAQRSQYAEALSDVVGKPIEEYLSDTGLKNVSRTIISPVVNELIKTLPEAKSSTAAKSAVQQAVQAVVKPVLLANTATAALSPTAVQAVVKTITKIITIVPIITPVPFILPSGPKEKKRKGIIKLPPGTVAWKQGFGWWVIEPKNQGYFVKTKPVGATMLDKGKLPSQTIQTIAGKEKQRQVTVDMGIVDVKIDRPGKTPGRSGAIKFKADPSQRTKSGVTLGKSKKVDRMYKTPTKRGHLLSRRRLR